MASITPIFKYPPKELSEPYNLSFDGRVGRKVQAWMNNPAFDTRDPPVDTTITVKPPQDLIEEMFPPTRTRSLFRRLSIQFWAVIIFIIAHAVVTAYTDPIYTPTPLVQVIVYSGQVGLLLAIIMAFFVLTSSTLYIQYGRYDLYLQDFAFIYLFWLLELALYVAVKVYATVLLLQRASYLAIWDYPGYYPLWVIQRVVLLLFWAAAAISAISVFDARYFDPEQLVRRSKNEQETADKKR